MNEKLVKRMRSYAKFKATALDIPFKAVYKALKREQHRRDKLARLGITPNKFMERASPILGRKA